MSVCVEVPLEEDEIEALRVMLQAPGYQALLRLEDGYIAALDAAPMLMGRMDAHDPDIAKAFLRANMAREFRDIINAEVLRIVNTARGGLHTHDEDGDTESPLAMAMRPQHQIPTLQPIPPQPAVQSKYRR